MGKPPTAEILPTDTPSLFDAAVVRAADALGAGELVALPTETVYGLAANALNADAVRNVFEVKGRPTHNPIIVHVAGLEMARLCVANWPLVADRLAKSFWPGPLTLVLPRSNEIPGLVTAGGDTVGVRWPSHPFIQAVIRACGFPLAMPSANPSAQISPTSAEHVRKSLGDKIRLIVDGGLCQVGIESTVVDLTGEPPRILRPGMIHSESLLAVTGELVQPHLPEHKTEKPRSPGMLVKHYAPKARLLVCHWRDDADLRRQLSAVRSPLLGIHVISHTRIPSDAGFGRISVIPHDPEAFARALYAELHRCDEEKAELIVVESVPDSVEWHGVGDRLRRAMSL